MLNMWQWFKTNRQMLYAVAVLIGSMVGVGIFGLPLVFAKAGFLVGLLFLLLVGGLTILIDLMYGEIVLRTKESHQLVGYAELYINKYARRALFFSIALNGYAAFVAYMIVAGQFLSNIFSHLFYFSADFYSLIFIIIFSVLVFAGVKRFSFIELSLTVLFILIMLVIFGSSLGRIDLNNLIDFSSTRAYWFLPYGVLLFAFGGLNVVPIQRRFLIGQERRLPRAILFAVGLVACLYFVFVLSVVGVAGSATSDNSITDLFNILGNKMMLLCSLFGVIAVGSSFLVLGSALQDVFILDFGLKKIWSWLLTILPPTLLYFGGLRNFVDVIGLGGAIGLGFEAIILTFIFIKARKKGDREPEYSLRLSKPAVYLMVLLFIAGALLKLFLDAG